MIRKSLNSVQNLLSRLALYLSPINKSPDKLYGELLSDIQMNQVYDDGMTFVGLASKTSSKRILKEYLKLKDRPDFDLEKFAHENFEPIPSKANDIDVPNSDDPRTHISQLWPTLRRSPVSTKNNSLISLPYDYIVPGGRFQEQFYWDSYFVMLGLAADDRWQDISGMMANYVYMVSRLGFIPTANRTHFISRSQPPFFSEMVRLVGSHKKKGVAYLQYLPTLLAEYRFWMAGSLKSKKGKSFRRVVTMDDKSLLNRYYDNLSSPRPESHREDTETAVVSEIEDAERLFLDLRAGAESGWDFSSRWFKDPQKIETIHTTDIIPVDLNCLLYRLESLIAECYGLLRLGQLRRQFEKKASKRAQAILKYCWNEQEQFFDDFDFVKGEHTNRLTLASVFPLYAGIATLEQAKKVADRLERDFLMPGGLTTTLIENGQQWDHPNGWAPLQWIAIIGLRNYGFNELANEVKRRWLESVETVFRDKHKMIEKYDVTSASRVGGGGEYALQDGFGWTNGVYAALVDEDK